jgi:hypothetical protein
MDVIEQLASNIVNMTSSYKICQEREAKLASDLALVQAQLFPLRKENANLLR